MFTSAEQWTGLGKLEHGRSDPVCVRACIFPRQKGIVILIALGIRVTLHCFTTTVPSPIHELQALKTGNMSIHSAGLGHLHMHLNP